MNRCLLRRPESFAVKFRYPWEVVRLNALNVASNISYLVDDGFLLRTLLYGEHASRHIGARVLSYIRCIDPSFVEITGSAADDGR